MKEKLSVHLAVIAVACVMGGCTTIEITDLHLYKEAPLVDADVMPTPEQIKSERAKVIILESDDSSVSARLPDAGLVQTKKLEEVFSGSGVEIIDRGLFRRMQEEISLVESRGGASTSYSGPTVAQYVVKSFVTDVGIDTEFHPEKISCDKEHEDDNKRDDKKDGKRDGEKYRKNCKIIPASCTYTGMASGGVRVYEIPNLNMISSFNLRGMDSTTSDGYCRGSWRLNMSLAQRGVEMSVLNSRTELQNLFAPKGYVVEKRVHEDKVIFKVMLGKLHGAKSQDSLIFYTLNKTQNRLTHAVTFEEISMGTGVISDQIKDDYSWVVPDDLEKAKMVRLGDLVKVKYHRGFLD